ncbi:hypothetical protein JCM10207_004936 [Rhodosporidiobolus poonsookiae]
MLISIASLSAAERPTPAREGPPSDPPLFAKTDGAPAAFAPLTVDDFAWAVLSASLASPDSLSDASGSKTQHEAIARLSSFSASVTDSTSQLRSLAAKVDFLQPGRGRFFISNAEMGGLKAQLAEAAALLEKVLEGIQHDVMQELPGLGDVAKKDEAAKLEREGEVLDRPLAFLRNDISSFGDSSFLHELKGPAPAPAVIIPVESETPLSTAPPTYTSAVECSHIVAVQSLDTFDPTAPAAEHRAAGHGQPLVRLSTPITRRPALWVGGVVLVLVVAGVALGVGV